MKDWSRRALFRASAGAAVAVPMGALGSTAAHAATRPEDMLDLAGQSAVNQVSGPVMFCVHDAARGEVSILHGTSEVIVRDRRLVARILQASGSLSTLAVEKA